MENENQLVITAEDKAGNISSQSVNVIYIPDNEPPVLTFTFPADGSILDKAGVTVNGTVTDKSNILYVKVNGINAVVDTQNNTYTVDLSLRSPLKVPIITTFKGIVVQVRIFGLEMPFLPFSAEIFSWKWHFCHFRRFSTFPINSSRELPKEKNKQKVCLSPLIQQTLELEKIKFQNTVTKTSKKHSP